MDTTRSLNRELAEAYDRMEITATDYLHLSRSLRDGHDEDSLRQRLQRVRRGRKVSV